MQSPKFTPGPWDRNEIYKMLLAQSQGPFPKVSFTPTAEVADRMWADACLISAATEMYAEIFRSVDECFCDSDGGTLCERCARRIKLLAKAEGSANG